MGVTTFVPGKLVSADQARYLVLIAQQKTVGLNDTQKDELKALEVKLRMVK